MKKYTHEGRTYYFHVFVTDQITPFMLLSTTEDQGQGMQKVYFLSRYSMKYAMEDFHKFILLMETKKANSAVQ